MRDINQATLAVQAKTGTRKARPAVFRTISRLSNHAGDRFESSILFMLAIVLNQVSCSIRTTWSMIKYPNCISGLKNEREKENHLL
jgi:hypothetical protein